MTQPRLGSFGKEPSLDPHFDRRKRRFLDTIRAAHLMRYAPCPTQRRSPAQQRRFKFQTRPPEADSELPDLAASVSGDGPSHVLAIRNVEIGP
jgi:hypothetical protein